MILQAIEIENFQSLKKVNLTLGRVTILTGDSNAGKTAVIRALRGLVENRSSNGLIRQGELKLRVQIKVKDHTIEWLKGPATNDYVIDGVYLKAVGRGAPLQLIQILNLETRKVLGIEFNPNFRDQFSMPPLVYDSESERLIKLGVISGIGLLTTAGRLAVKDKKQLDSSIKSAQTLIEEREREIAKYSQWDVVVKIVESTVIKPLQDRMDLVEKAITYKKLVAEIPPKPIEVDPVWHAARWLIQGISLSQMWAVLLSTSEVGIVIDPDWASRVSAAISLVGLRLELEKKLPEPVSFDKCKYLYAAVYYQQLLQERGQVDLALLDDSKETIDLQDRRNKILEEIKLCPTCNRPI